MTYRKWDEDFETGLTNIDSQHRELLDTINALHAAIEDPASSEYSTENLLNFLFIYTNMHLNDEEEEFEKTDYPDKDRHKAIHQEFRESIEDFQNKLANDETEINHYVFDYLSDWLINHILQIDQEAAVYIRKARDTSWEVQKDGTLVETPNH